MIHLYLHNIPIFQELIRKVADSARSASHDGRAFPQSRSPREVSNNLLHRPDHVVSGSFLLELAIHLGPEVELLRIRNNARRCYGCADGSKAIKGFRVTVLTAAHAVRDLEVPRGYVVPDRIPKDEVEGVLLRGVLAVLPDDNGHLAFPIDLGLRVSVYMNVVRRPDHGICRFDEDHRVSWNVELSASARPPGHHIMHSILLLRLHADGSSVLRTSRSECLVMGRGADANVRS
jgi:hypothetical protein